VQASFPELTMLLETNRTQPRAVLPVVEAMLATHVSDQRLLLRIRALEQALSSAR
jgi:hypothetical protein